ncbi:MAG: MFS transporter, partial [Spirochaetota bacterium]
MVTFGFIVVLFLAQIFGLARASPLSIGLWIAVSALVLAISLAFLPESGLGRPKPSSAKPKVRARFDPVLALGLVMIALGRLAMAPINSFLTLYITEYLHSDTASLLWALAAIVEVPALILAGRLVAKMGAMPVIALTTVAIVLRLALYALVPTLTGALIGQLLHFFCYGLFLPASIAFVSSRVPPGRRAWGMALFTSLGIALPSFIGSSIGGFVLESDGYPALFAWYTLPALLSLAIYATTARKFRA